MLGDATKHKTLIFDMDETLVHCVFLKNENDFHNKGDKVVKCTKKDGKELIISIKFRPGLFEVLEHLS